MGDVMLLVAGMATAALGGEVFVRGAVRLAQGLRVQAGVIGVTVAAFATSAPEMAVGINAALAGTPQIAAGDVLGSNVVNIALVLGAVILVAPLPLGRREVRRDLPLTVASPLLLGLLTLDGWLSRTDGAVLVTVFAAWLTTTVLQAIRDRHDDLPTRMDGMLRTVMLVVGGAILLITAGRLVVLGASGIGQTLGVSPFLIGATLVALGTSMPELATAVVARLRGHSALGAGTVIGSNVFNSLLIVGVVALVRPFPLMISETAIAVVAGALAALMLIPGRTWTLSRRRGGVLVGGYAVYLALLVVVSG